MHFEWNIYVRFKLAIMAEYPVMSTSQGTYVQIELTSEAIRVTYEICRGGARGLELRTAGIRQGSKRNADSVSVEELDWSAESQVLIPAEHLWCDFKCRHWAKNSSPNTNDIWVQSFHTLQNCCNRCGNTIFKNMNYVFIFVATVWKCLFLF